VSDTNDRILAAETGTHANSVRAPAW